MNKSDGLFSIFGEAAHRSQAKKKAPEHPAPSVEFPHKKISSGHIEALNTEIQTNLNQVRDLHDELNRKLEDIYQKTGWDPHHIKKYLENPNNFSPEQWQLIQSQKKYLLGKVWDKLGKEGVNLQKKMLEAEKQKISKDRKGKALGARRQWIPM